MYCHATTCCYNVYMQCTNIVAIVFLAMTNIVAIENVATEFFGGNNKLCNRNYFEARNDIATR